MSKERPSEEMQEAISAATIRGLGNALDWNFTETVMGSVLTYIEALWENEGPHSFRIGDSDDGALSIGCVAWDENGDDMLVSKQYSLVDVALRHAFDDPYEALAVADGLERTASLIRQKVAGTKAVKETDLEKTPAKPQES